jgi:hypothetical protein
VFKGGIVFEIRLRGGSTPMAAADGSSKVRREGEGA